MVSITSNKLSFSSPQSRRLLPLNRQRPEHGDHRTTGHNSNQSLVVLFLCVLLTAIMVNRLHDTDTSGGIVSGYLGSLRLLFYNGYDYDETTDDAFLPEGSTVVDPAAEFSEGAVVQQVVHEAEAEAALLLSSVESNSTTETETDTYAEQEDVQDEPPFNSATIQLGVLMEMVLMKTPSCKGKEGFLKILLASGRHPRTITQSDCDRLPTQQQVMDRFGPKPVIFGLDTCETYRKMLVQQAEDNSTRSTSPAPRVAGLFNTGTHALENAFMLNIQALRPRPGEHAYDVPWGKHMPPAVFRLNNTIPVPNRDNRFRVLPVVLIRDPFYWMRSMCKEWYDLKWNKPPTTRRCPAIIKESSNQPYKVYAKFMQAGGVRMNYTSLPDLWSDWNRQYYDADYPRLIIRFEDTLYRLEEVINKIRKCIGMPKMEEPLKRMLQKAKQHGTSSDLVSSIENYFHDDGKYHGLTEADRQYVNQVLDPKLMKTFRYNYAPVTVEDPKDLEGPWPGMDKPLATTRKWWPQEE